MPGPSGLDDAVQVVVEIGDQPGPYANSTRTHTLLRDELGTVIGLVAEDEGKRPGQAAGAGEIPVHPYGEGHAESGPELLRARFDSQATEVETTGGTTTQTVADETAAAAGALVLDWTSPCPIPAILFDKKLVPRFESWETAKDTVGGRFPGGQTALFQGLWTDPADAGW